MQGSQLCTRDNIAVDIIVFKRRLCSWFHRIRVKDYLKLKGTMNSQAEWKLILKYLSDSLTPEEKRRFNAWLQSDFENQKLLHLIETIWYSPEKGHSVSDIKTAWENLAKKSRISTPFENQHSDIRPLSRSYARKILFARSAKATRILRIAAVLLLATFIHLFYKGIRPSFQAEAMNEMGEISVDYGKTAVVTLTDGTKITLDAGSTLAYPQELMGDIRQVYLSGEAFFEVTANPQKPFVIHANEAVIKVLGTQFNVSAWPKLREIRVAVAEGKVAFRSKDHDEKKAVIVEKGELSILWNKKVLTQPVDVDVKKYLAWLDREMILDNTPLYEALDRLKRWYKLEFELPSPVYNSVRISGTIRKEPINDIIKILSLAVNLEFKRIGNRIIFMEKSS